MMYQDFEDPHVVPTRSVSATTFKGQVLIRKLPTKQWAGHPFSAYAARFWMDHVRGTVELEQESLLLRFLTHRNILNVFHLSLRMWVDPDPEISRILPNSDSFPKNLGLDPEVAVYFCTYFRFHLLLMRLLKQGVSPEFRAFWGRRCAPLHVAVVQNDRESLNLLIKAGANLHSQDKHGFTPLYLDTLYNFHKRTSLASTLLEAGANPDVHSHDGRTVLWHAFSENQHGALQDDPRKM